MNSAGYAIKTHFVLHLVSLGLVIGPGVAVAQSAGTFTPTGSMITPRSRHTATLLTNGKVLIVGGLTGCFAGIPCTDTNSAEIYDPATGAFTATGRMTMSGPTGGVLLPD